MKTKEQLIIELIAKNPTLRKGSEELGYEDLDQQEYESVISDWANNILDQQTKEAETKAAQDAALAKLTALGLTADDLAALGL